MTLIERIRKLHWGWKVLFFAGLWFVWREIIYDVFYVIGYAQGFAKGISTP